MKGINPADQRELIVAIRLLADQLKFDKTQIAEDHFRDFERSFSE